MNINTPRSVRMSSPICVLIWKIICWYLLVEETHLVGTRDIWSNINVTVRLYAQCRAPKWGKGRADSREAHLHDDVIKWKQFPRYWPFVGGIHRSPVNSPRKGQWRGALMLPLICVWMNGWVNNRQADDLRRHRAHYDVTLMSEPCSVDDFALFAELNHWTKIIMAANKYPFLYAKEPIL